MKKLFLLVSLPVVAAGLSLAIMNKPTVLYAEGEEPETSEPAPESSEEPITSSEEPVETEESKALDEVKAWLNQHLDKQMVANIITWCSEAGVLTGLLGIYIKYRKFKYKTLEDLVNLVKAEVGKYLTEAFNNLSEEKIKKLEGAVETLEQSNETMMKVLVLMQDSTKAGKVALLDFLGSKTNSKEVKEAAEEVTKELEEQKVKEDAVKEAVKEDYEKIF